jgi:DNA-binding transcriptional ArsR family regulator
LVQTNLGFRARRESIMKDHFAAARLASQLRRTEFPVARCEYGQAGYLSIRAAAVSEQLRVLYVAGGVYEDFDVKRDYAGKPSTKMWGNLGQRT